MRNSQLFIKKLDLAEKIDLSHVKLKTARTKSSISFKTKTKRSSLDFNSKLVLGSQFNTVASLQSIKSSEFLGSRNSPHSQSRRFHEEPAKNPYNNYQFFPKRSLLVKPHTVKNTKIALNLFGKKMIDNQQRLSVLAQSLYKQLNDMRASHPQKQTATHTPRKPRVPTRAQSAPFQRKESMKFQPWEIGELREDENR